MENDPGLGGAWSPEPAASAHLAPDPEPAPAARRAFPRVAFVVAAAVIVAGVLWWALSPGTTVVLPVAEAGRALAPLQTAADPRTGEVTAPFSGFAVSVETIPPGALVTIDGQVRGEAPVLAGIECAPGDRVEITARRPSGGPVRTSTTCREDTLVKLTVRLPR